MMSKDKSQVGRQWKLRTNRKGAISLHISSGQTALEAPGTHLCIYPRGLLHLTCTQKPMREILAQCKLQELPVSGYLTEPHCVLGGPVLCGWAGGGCVTHTSSLSWQPIWRPNNSCDSFGSFPCLVRYLPPHVPPSHLWWPSHPLVAPTITLCVLMVFYSLHFLIWAKDQPVLGTWIQIPNWSTVYTASWDPGSDFPRGEIGITENCGNLLFKHFFPLEQVVERRGRRQLQWPSTPRNFSKRPGIMGICSVCFEEVFLSCWDHTRAVFGFPGVLGLNITV